MDQKRAPKRRPFARNKNRTSVAEKPAVSTRPESLAAVQTSIDSGSYIVFDIETTGGNPERNGITDIFAIKYQNGQILETFGTLVNPKIPIPPIVRKMTGITNAMVRHAPEIHEVMPEFVDFAGHSILVSHNTIGDMKFIRYFTESTTGKEFDNFFLCTHLLVERLFPETPDKSLTGLVKYFGIESGDMHRAEADGYATLGLFEVLMEGLKDRKIERIDEAIRFQGDMESALRLGWAVPQKILDELPQRPGLFRLFDSENKEMFVSSAQNIYREVQRLKTSSQLPRQLLKMVLRAYHVTYEETSSLFQAMLCECELSGEKPSGALIHQRQVLAFTISKGNANNYQLAVDGITPGVVQAYGAVRDRRTASDLVEIIAEIFGQKTSRDGATFTLNEIRLIKGFFERTLGTLKTKLQKKSKGFSTLFQPAKKRRYMAELKLIEKLESIDLSPKVQSLLNRSGLLAVRQDLPNQPRPQGNGISERWDVYGICDCQPISSKVYDGPIDQLLSSAVASELWGLIVASQFNKAKGRSHKKSLTPLSQKEAKIVNATLWWLLNLRSDGRFFPLVEELRIGS